MKSKSCLIDLEVFILLRCAEQYTDSRDDDGHLQLRGLQ